MNRNSITLSVLVVILMKSVACMPPSTNDIVIKGGSGFTKESTLTLTLVDQDPAIFKPELERELLRHGFNVISDSVAQTISHETKRGEVKSGEVQSNNSGSNAAAAKSEGGEITDKQVSTLMKSDYTGKLEYLYHSTAFVVTRVNLTIIHLKTGTVVASMSYSFNYKTQNFTNKEAASEIAKRLDEALTAQRKVSEG